jgi:F-type H+-transporting ATPase subunit epsilon
LKEINESTNRQTNESSMYLEIITPDKRIFEGEVISASFPGTDGSFQVLNDHAPLISLLKDGVVEYKSKESTQRLNITGGVVEVLTNKVIVLADGVQDN